MNYKLIKANQEDLLTINILVENNIDHDLVYTLNYLKYLYNLENYLILKLEDNLKIIGVIILKLEDNLNHIAYFIIDKEYQRKGLGSFILKNIKKYNSNKITLNVNTKNIKAINFYKKNGFNIKRINKQYYSNKDDSYYMIFENNNTTEHFYLKKKRKNKSILILLIIIYFIIKFKNLI
jgi:ribosomal protein S18 acetylase RimI-like enzyme